MGQFLDHASLLRNLYWRIRYARTANQRRTWYRKVAKEKGQLVALGYSYEVVRLYGLHLRNPAREVRFHRFEHAFEEFQNGPKQLRLFP